MFAHKDIKKRLSKVEYFNIIEEILVLPKTARSFQNQKVARSI